MIPLDGPLGVERRDLAADRDHEAVERDVELGMIATGVRRALRALRLEPGRRNLRPTADGRSGKVDPLGFGAQMGLWGAQRRVDKLENARPSADLVFARDRRCSAC